MSFCVSKAINKRLFKFITLLLSLAGRRVGWVLLLNKSGLINFSSVHTDMEKVIDYFQAICEWNFKRVERIFFFYFRIKEEIDEKIKNLFENSRLLPLIDYIERNKFTNWPLVCQEVMFISPEIASQGIQIISKDYAYIKKTHLSDVNCHFTFSLHIPTKRKWKATNVHKFLQRLGLQCTSELKFRLQSIAKMCSKCDCAKVAPFKVAHLCRRLWDAVSKWNVCQLCKIDRTLI